MLEVKTRLVTPALMALAGIALVGCSASQDGPNYPPPPTTVATANFKLDLATSTLVVPYPYDLYFALPGSAGGRHAQSADRTVALRRGAVRDERA